METRSRSTGDGWCEALYARAVGCCRGGSRPAPACSRTAGAPSTSPAARGPTSTTWKGGATSTASTRTAPPCSGTATRPSPAVRRVLDLGVLCAAENELQVAAGGTSVPGDPLRRAGALHHLRHRDDLARLRVARAYTGRDPRASSFEGHFHGFNDTLGFSSARRWPWPGRPDAPPGVAGERRDAPGSRRGSDRGAVQRPVGACEGPFDRPRRRPGGGDPGADQLRLRRHPAGAGLPRDPARPDPPGRRGADLRRDPLRLPHRPRRGQEYLGVTPDLCTLGKALGGGMPLSAFAGRREIMQAVSPVGKAVHSGTYNAHLRVAAALAFLDEIAAAGLLPRPAGHGGAPLRRAAGGLRPARAAGLGAGRRCRFGLLFGLDAAPQNYRQAAATGPRSGATCAPAWNGGCTCTPARPHHGYTAAHTAGDIDEMLQIADDAVRGGIRAADARGESQAIDFLRPRQRGRAKQPGEERGHGRSTRSREAIGADAAGWPSGGWPRPGPRAPPGRCWAPAAPPAAAIPGPGRPS